MTTIAFPDTPGIPDIQWTPPASTQVNRSIWAGKRRVTKLPFGGFWTARVTLAPIMGAAEFRQWRDFLMACEGAANNFRIVAVEEPQNSQITVKVNGGGQTGLSLVTDGWAGSGIALRKGELLTVNNQLISVAADVNISGGAATISLRRRLRSSPADNADVEVRLPWALMAMPQDELPYSVTKGQIYGVSFACEEDVP
jgi:hypothetical protein